MLLPTNPQHTFKRPPKPKLKLNHIPKPSKLPQTELPSKPNIILPFPQLPFPQLYTSSTTSFGSRSHSHLHSTSHSNSRKTKYFQTPSLLTSRHSSSSKQKHMITDSKETTDNSRRSRKSVNSSSRPPTCKPQQTVRPFTITEGTKLSRHNSTTDRNEHRTNLNVIKLDVDYINSNNMFCEDNNKELKYEVHECSNKKRNERNVKADRQSKLIYNGMIGCFKDSKVKCNKDIKDKTVVNEVVETKKSIRFWKAVFDVSYTRIVMNYIKEGNYGLTGRCWREEGTKSKRKNLSQKIKRKFKKFYFSRFDTE